MSKLYIVSNENTVRILNEENLINHFEDLRIENNTFHSQSSSQEIREIPLKINKELPNGVLNINDVFKLWDLDAKHEYPLFWVINTDTMEADFRNYWESSFIEKFKLSFSKDELLNYLEYGNSNKSSKQFLFEATQQHNKDKLLKLLWIE